MHATKSKSDNRLVAPETRGRTIQWANHYDTVVGLMTLGRDKALREMTCDLARIQPGNSVLDVGCGTGALTMAAKARVGSTGKVYGIDASLPMIEAARAKATKHSLDIDFRVDLIESLSFPDNTFDIVLSSLMMHHLPDDLKVKGLSDIYRVLKPSGRLIVVDMTRPANIHDRLMTALLRHGNVATGVQDLPTMMKTTGFTHIETGDLGLLQLGFARGESGAN